jgi:hypothetical protein
MQPPRYTIFLRVVVGTRRTLSGIEQIRLPLVRRDGISFGPAGFPVVSFAFVEEPSLAGSIPSRSVGMLPNECCCGRGAHRSPSVSEFAFIYTLGRFLSIAIRGYFALSHKSHSRPVDGKRELAERGDSRPRTQTHAPERTPCGPPAQTSTGAAVVLAGEHNVMPTELDVNAPERWLDDALFRPEVCGAYAGRVAQGWTDVLRELHPGQRIYIFWKSFRNAFARDAGLRLDHFLLSPSIAGQLRAAEVDRAVRGWEQSAITRRFGSNSPTKRQTSTDKQRAVPICNLYTVRKSAKEARPILGRRFPSRST